MCSKKKTAGFLLIGFEFITPILAGVVAAVILLEGIYVSKNSIYWFFGATIQAFAALLGLIGLIIAFRIQHIRDQIRDIQNAILKYAHNALGWIFAGFDIEEIKKRKDFLFDRLKKTNEEIRNIEEKKQALDAFESEKLRFEKLLDNYTDLDTERQQLYDVIIPTMVLIIGTIIISIIGLVFSETIYTTLLPIFFGIVALSVWGILRIGKFLIMMTLREKTTKVFITVETRVKDKT